MPNFQVVVLSFNHPDITTQAVSSALHFTGNVILVHNGSILENREKLMRAFPQIEHISMEENKGYSGGANVALKAGFLKSPWVLFLTNDCTIEKFPDATPSRGLWGAHVMWRNSDKTDNYGGRFFPSQGKLVHCKSAQEFQTMAGRKYIPGSAFLLDRKSFEEVGEFDESLETFWEDVDWSMRAAEKNILLNVSDDFVVRHGGGKTTKKKAHYTRYLFPRNRARVSRKYCRNWLERLRLEMSLFSRRS